jgi:hypothetical protein
MARDPSLQLANPQKHDNTQQGIAEPQTNPQLTAMHKRVQLRAEKNYSVNPLTNE